MTSVPLSPDRKDKVVAALQPWIRNPSDVIGRDDISGLLARHNEVERRHIKLWLTSAEVLDALLNSDIATRSEGAIEHARRQLRLWVPNQSFERARAVLDDARVCVISGAPGVGKSMLADVLLAVYTKLGYEPVVISGDIDEGERTWRSTRRQIFHYDDFLGHVTYGELRLRKNEGSRLAQFVNRIHTSNDKRIILTTREYILSEAIQRYERLADIDFQLYKSIVSLKDYTDLIRAKILYNHLFFSNLPSELKTALVPRQQYWDIIRHRNYNPRTIDHAVNMPAVSRLKPSEFVDNMLETLNNPAGLWERIFGNLPSMSRSVLLAMASLPSEVLLEDLQNAVRNLSPGSFDPGEFRSAMKMVDGSFLNIEATNILREGRGKRTHIISIRDPSVSDYMWSRFEAVGGEIEILLSGAIFFEQCIVLYEGHNHAAPISRRIGDRKARDESRRVVADHDAIAKRALALIGSSSPLLTRLANQGRAHRVREVPRLERRTTFLAHVLAENQGSQAVAEAATQALLICRGEWEAGKGSASEGIDLLRMVKGIEKLLPSDAPKRAGQTFLGLIADRLEESEDFAALVELAELWPELFIVII